jgi:hypothetical protein
MHRRIKKLLIGLTIAVVLLITGLSQIKSGSLFWNGSYRISTSLQERDYRGEFFILETLGRALRILKD